MSMVCHMNKLKSADLNGVRKEDDRSCDAINKKNPDLDLSRTKDNYTIYQKKSGEIKIATEFKNGKTPKWDEMIKRRVRHMEKQNLKNGGKRFRKDAVVCGSFVLGADKDFMDNLSPAEQKKYFLMMYNYMGKHYGFNNIASFTVHMDEGSVGAHCRVFPLKDGKLCAKQLFTPADLSQIQRELYDYLKSEFPELQAPDFGNSKRKHLDEMTYKYQQEKAKLDDLEKQISGLRLEISDLSNEKEKLKDSCIDAEKRLESAYNAFLELNKEVSELENKKNSVLTQISNLEIGLNNIIALRNELVGILNQKAHDFGIGFKQTTEGYILDIQNHMRKTRDFAKNTPKVRQHDNELER